ncbi:hypothetical protein [Clostridium cibarium]|uniref:Uncharacterized protein n=1 Tax=Clostridium cibarium TaxID=2762247 RepID=A0ABR8PXQ5_9CLOT|nr:hypothetical protein [Clostridium cibarium]MBD7912938.1 hypothetical protein [Clostridium cibarium]
MSLNFISFDQLQNFVKENIPDKYITSIGTAYKVGIKQNKDGFGENDFEYMGYPIDYKYLKNGISIPIKMQVLELEEFKEKNNEYINSKFKPVQFFFMCIDNCFEDEELSNILKKDSFAYINEDEPGGWWPNTVYYFPMTKLKNYFKNKNDNYESNLFITDIKNYMGNLRYHICVAGCNSKGISEYCKNYDDTNTNIIELEDLLCGFKNAKVYSTNYYISDEVGSNKLVLDIYTTNQMLNKLPGKPVRFI